MIRRSLSQALRYRGVTVGNDSTCNVRSRSFHRRAHHHHLPSLKICYWNQESNGHDDGPPAPPTPQFTSSRPFTSSVVFAQDGRHDESYRHNHPNHHSRVYSPRSRDRDHQTHFNNDRSSNRHHDNEQRHWRGGRNNGDNSKNFNYNNNHNNRDNNNNNGNSESFRPSYIAELETRAKAHIQNFPVIHHSSSSKIGYNSDASLLMAPWHRTATEIIFLMAKLWGKRGHNGKNHDEYGPDSKMTICRFVSLTNDLLVKVLMSRKNEVDSILEELEGDTSLSNELSDHGAKIDYSHLKGGIERQTTEVLCQTVALGWSRCDPTIATDAAHKNQAILDMLEDICSRRARVNDMLHLSGRKKEVSFQLKDVMSPNTKLYNHVLNSWSRSLDPDAEMHLKGLLDRMGDEESRGTLFPRPDTISYNNLLNLYARRGKVDAAEALLLEMEEEVRGVTPDVYSYSIVMNAFQRRFTSGGPNERSRKDPERAEEILSNLVTKYEKSGFRSAKLRPSNVTFGTVVAMYAQADRILKEDDRINNMTRNWKAKMTQNANHKDKLGWGAANAERVLDWIIGLNERERKSKKIGSTDGGEGGAQTFGGFDPENDLIRPSAIHFMTVMDAWAKAGKGVEGAQRSERLLNRLLSMYDKLGYIELRPAPLVFGTVIDAWAKADDRPESAEHAESLLDRMVDLFLHKKSRNKREMISNIAYNLVIDAWSRRSGKWSAKGDGTTDTAERAENILRRLVSNYHMTNNSLLRPDVISYTGVMKAYVHHPNGGKKVLELLSEMNDEYRGGNAKARPDMKCIAVAMDACVKSGATSEAERLLNNMDDSKKNCLMFNTIISGYAQEGRVAEAEAVLQRMISLSEDGGWERCAPDTISYTLCLKACGKSTSPERVPRARAILDECIRRYQSGKNKSKPSNVIFNDFADIISNSDEPDKVTDVLALFEKMESTGEEPSLISFNILIKTCANETTESDERKRNALQIAASAFNSLPSVGLNADSITYTGMMHVLLNLMNDSPEKVNAISGIFRQCCDEGYLNQHILNVLTSATSEDDLITVTGVSSKEEAYTLGRLPPDWSRNSSRDLMVNAE